MNDNQSIYALFNIVNDSPFWIGLLNTIVSVFLGAWIVYRFDIKVNNKKTKEFRILNFENLKIKIGRTLEEYRLIGSYISEYKSKGEFQIVQKECTNYFNENLYNIRVSNFDLFRIKYAELRGLLLFELNELDNYIEKNSLLIDLIRVIERYNIPCSIPFDKDNIFNQDGEIITEQNIDSLVLKKLKEANELLDIVDEVKSIIPTLKYKE